MKKVDVNEAHSVFSSLRERIIEHLFLGKLLRHFWRSTSYGIEVSRAESDSFGYDVVLEWESTIRHIQLKSNLKRPRSLSIARSLEQKPSACVIWIGVTSDLEMKEFGWFGNAPGIKLKKLSNFEKSLRIGRNRQGERPERSNHVDIPFAKNFDLYRDISEISERLFSKPIQSI